MKLYFKDNQKNLRAVETDWELDVLNDQISLKAAIKTASDITPCSPIFAVV